MSLSCWENAPTSFRCLGLDELGKLDMPPSVGKSRYATENSDNPFIQFHNLAPILPASPIRPGLSVTGTAA